MTIVSAPCGIFTDTSRRLCSRARVTESAASGAPPFARASPFERASPFAFARPFERALPFVRLPPFVACGAPSRKAPLRCARAAPGPSAFRAVRALGGVPSPTRRPPCAPAPGPRSKSQSARETRSRSCSTMTTLPPASTITSSAATSFTTSSACRPALGSSRTNSEPSWRSARARASLMRCASPPESVVSG